jgi:hypothetical protein
MKLKLAAGAPGAVGRERKGSGGGVGDVRRCSCAAGFAPLTSSRRLRCEEHCFPGFQIESFSHSSPLPLNGAGLKSIGRLSRASLARFSSASRSNFAMASSLRICHSGFVFCRYLD